MLGGRVLTAETGHLVTIKHNWRRSVCKTFEWSSVVRVEWLANPKGQCRAMPWSKILFITVSIERELVLNWSEYFARHCIPKWRQCHPSLMLLITADVSTSLLNKAPQTLYLCFLALAHFFQRTILSTIDWSCLVCQACGVGFTVLHILSDFVI